ncbi:hypothetical protein PTSG_02885 [Salpingoeca rosetta]|uniref:NmrA-like domain-containing protein n=1 Tax=Salpingoeca rosetta (strain ATCC 50818 / BSB-021) TaxID=946362 RepID=F2U3M1_SALR5|nr:uncharacterized protein PTSG_02885 [Salpingoeca rosetta]EGD82215.1 hypothetical protein PTSG_02885 [Salpingoeca rosetta]|eukprot:XP_004996398.1 hypothetical protein PTSG_02885 [Salpingoeca rosetta]
MPSNIVVLGSTGFVGTSTIKTLASRYSAQTQVRAATRDPSSDKAKALAADNVMVVKGDMSDPASLDNIIQKDDAVFVVTPGHIERTKLAIAGVDAAKRNGAKFVLVVSVLTTGTDSIFGRQFAPLEKHVQECGIPYSLVRLPFFIDNAFGNQEAIKGGKYYAPAKPDVVFTPVAVADVGEACAAILADPSKHANTIYSLTSKPMTHKDIVAGFSKALGKPVEYVQVPYDAAKKSFMDLGMPEWQVDGVLELFRYFDASAKVTNNPTDDIKKITGHDPLDAEAWMKSVKGAFA